MNTSFKNLFNVKVSPKPSYGNDYLSSFRREFAQLVKESGDRPLKDVQKELGSLINNAISSTRAAALEEVRKKFEDAGFDVPPDLNSN